MSLRKQYNYSACNLVLPLVRGRALAVLGVQSPFLQTMHVLARKYMRSHLISASAVSVSSGEDSANGCKKAESVSIRPHAVCRSPSCNVQSYRDLQTIFPLQVRMFPQRFAPVPDPTWPRGTETYTSDSSRKLEKLQCFVKSIRVEFQKTSRLRPSLLLRTALCEIHLK